MKDRVPYSVAAFRRAWLDPSLTIKQIGVRFGLSRSGAGARGLALGLPPRPKRTLAILPVQVVLRMHCLGMSHAAIAEYFGCHWMTVCNTLRRAGASGRGSGRRSSMTADEYRALVAAEERGRVLRAPSTVRDDLLLRLVAADVARRDIARVVGCHISTVSRRARALGAAPRRQGGRGRTPLEAFTDAQLAAAMQREIRNLG